MIRLLVLAALVVPTPAAAETLASPYLFLNRCRGGCIVNGGFDDARTMSSSIPCSGTANCGGGGCQCTGGSAGTYVIEEFKDAAGNTGAAADAEWNAIVHCVREVYSPYNIMVVDSVPPGGLSHNQGIVAGRPVNIGYGGAGIGGIAPGSLGCQPQDNVISFTFANIYAGANRVQQICAVAAQETAHSYGLDHAYEYADKSSACNDPMTYRSDCGGQKFFRNANATCGEFSPRSCRCGAFQNSHMRIKAIFGEGTPITRPPSVTLTAPADGAQINNGAIVTATASAQRGIAHMDLWLNNYKWASVKGAPFGSAGQPEFSYSLMLPANVPDGVIDVVVKAYDDIEVETESAQVTVTKGAPCTSASTCAAGQKCEQGRCFWDTPTGELGDECTYPQFCVSGLCAETTSGDMFCSQGCIVGVADSCPMDYTCEGEGGGPGYCVVADPEKACTDCSSGGDGRLLLVLVGGVGLVLRRRRRR